MTNKDVAQHMAMFVINRLLDFGSKNLWFSALIIMNKLNMTVAMLANFPEDAPLVILTVKSQYPGAVVAVSKSSPLQIMALTNDTKFS